MLAFDVFGIGKDDALLVISFDPYPLDTVSLTALARSNGASSWRLPTIACTNLEKFGGDPNRSVDKLIVLYLNRSHHCTS